LQGNRSAVIAGFNKKHYYSQPPLPPSDDPRTVSRHKGFLDHYHELIGTWTRKLRSRQQAEDLAHDAFVRVLENPALPVEQPRAYLHQTARNIAVDGYRREDRRQALEQEGLDLSPTPGDDPEAYVHALELADSVERALAELPLNCRKVFIWQKLEGLTQAEIAERMGLTKNMVEKYMIRTLRHLREHLDVSTR
jgi:RNA polymerase sigma-70 factor (ECF subfamily)